MKITSISAVTVEGNFNWPIVKVETDEGVTGYGEVHHHIKGQDGNASYHLENPADLALELSEPLVGTDPTDIAGRFEEIRRFGDYGPEGGGVSGVEIALWDIFGKSVGEPVWKLLGGKYRDEIPVYCDCRAGQPVADSAVDYALDVGDYSPEGYADHAVKREAQGFDFLKFDLHPSALEHVTGETGVKQGNITRAGLDYAEDITAAICNAIAAETDVGFDCYEVSQFPVPDALRFAERLDKYDPSVMEDLAPNDDVMGWARLTDSVTAPTLTGEHLYTVEGFEPLIRNDAVDVVGPDLLGAGGIRETVRICTFANQHGMAANLHFAGSPLAFMANVHAAAAIPEIIALEFHAVGVPWWADLIEETLFEDGRAPIPEKPGLGATLDEDVIFDHAHQDDWITA